MKNIKDLRVKYNHPSIPPKGIEINGVYLVSSLVEKYRLNQELVKVLFKPIDREWIDFDKKPRKRIEKGIEAEEDIEEIVDGVEI